MKRLHKNKIFMYIYSNTIFDIRIGMGLCGNFNEWYRTGGYNIFFYTLFTYNFLLVSRKLNEWEPKNVFNKTHVFFKFLESW